jgi:hypothetical protein
MKRNLVLGISIFLFSVSLIIPTVISKADQPGSCPEWIGNPPEPGQHEIFTAACTSDFCGNYAEEKNCSAVLN